MSVTRKRIYSRSGDGIFPSAPTAAHSLQLMRSLLVEVSTRGMSVKDASGNAVTEVYAETEFYNLAYSVRKEAYSLVTSPVVSTVRSMSFMFFPYMNSAPLSFPFKVSRCLNLPA